MDNQETSSFIRIIIPLKKSYRLKDFANRIVRMKKYFYLIVIIVILLLICIIIILLFENKKLNNKLNEEKNNLIYTEEGLLIIKRLFYYKKGKIKNNNRNQMHIAYSLDNKLVFPTFVSMLSGLENNKKNENVIIYHLIILKYCFQ